MRPFGMLWLILLLCSGSLTAQNSQTLPFSGLNDFVETLTFTQENCDPDLVTIQICLNFGITEGGQVKVDNESPEPATSDVLFGSQVNITSSDVSLFSELVPVPVPCPEPATVSDTYSFTLGADDGDSPDDINVDPPDGAAQVGSTDAVGPLCCTISDTGVPTFVSLTPSTFDIDVDADNIFQISSTGGVAGGFNPVTSGGTLSIEWGNCITLPVELSFFKGHAEGRDVVLDWRSETETNNAGFAVEHAMAKTEFREVGYVDGRGMSFEPVDYSFRVGNLDPGHHRFRLRQIDFDGQTEYTPQIEVVVEVPGMFVLDPAYPNPFNPSTTVRFALSHSRHVTLHLLDVLGRPYGVLYEGVPAANETQTVQVDGSRLPSGIYIVMLEGEGIRATQRITLLK